MTFEFEFEGAHRTLTCSGSVNDWFLTGVGIALAVSLVAVLVLRWWRRRREERQP